VLAVEVGLEVEVELADDVVFVVVLGPVLDVVVMSSPPHAPTPSAAIMKAHIHEPRSLPGLILVFTLQANARHRRAG
jgi:hypothetical protein